jgi:CDI immunity protein
MEEYLKIEQSIRSAVTNSSLNILAVYFSSPSILKNFVQEVDDLTKLGEGTSEQGILGCTFPRQLDEYEIINHGFDGISFSLYEDEIIVDVPTFRKYLKIACEAYCEINPESRAQLEKFLSRPQPPLEEGALPLWKEMRDAGKFPKPYSDFE